MSTVAVGTKLLRMRSKRLREVFPEVYSKTPSCLHDFDVINIDGKKLKDLPKRLLPARKLKGNIFGGKKEFPAADLLEVYAHRWDIEQLFQRVTEVYCLNEWISSTPKATIFQAAYCFFTQTAHQKRLEK